MNSFIDMFLIPFNFNNYAFEFQLPKKQENVRGGYKAMEP